MLKTSRFDGVKRIDSAHTLAGRGLYWTTAYLVDGLLVDTGCAHSATELLRALEDEHLTAIVNTHSHEDHIGANGMLQDQRSGMKILAHPLALPILAQPRQTQPLHPYRRLFWGWPEPSSGTPLQDGECLETEHHRFQVIFTPGHSPDHLCLYEAERGWLFTGDLFIGGKDRGLRPQYQIWQIIASLKRVVELPLARLYPGCARVRDNPREELRAKIAYLEEMGDRVLALHRQGWSVNRIARKLFGGPMFIELLTLGDFTRRNMVRSYLRLDVEGAFA